MNRGKSGRKRRIKGSKKGSSTESTGGSGSSSDFIANAPSQSQAMTAADQRVDFSALSEVGMRESKLPPLAGTSAEKISKYNEKSTYFTATL
jgi:hypothetical protein